MASSQPTITCHQENSSSLRDQNNSKQPEEGTTDNQTVPTSPTERIVRETSTTYDTYLLKDPNIDSKHISGLCPGTIVVSKPPVIVVDPPRERSQSPNLKSSSEVDIDHLDAAASDKNKSATKSSGDSRDLLTLLWDERIASDQLRSGFGRSRCYRSEICGDEHLLIPYPLKPKTAPGRRVLLRTTRPLYALPSPTYVSPAASIGSSIGRKMANAKGTAAGGASTLDAERGEKVMWRKPVTTAWERRIFPYKLWWESTAHHRGAWLIFALILLTGLSAIIASFWGTMHELQKHNAHFMFRPEKALEDQNTVLESFDPAGVQDVENILERDAGDGIARGFGMIGATLPFSTLTTESPATTQRVPGLIHVMADGGMLASSTDSTTTLTDMETIHVTVPAGGTPITSCPKSTSGTVTSTSQIDSATITGSSATSTVTYCPFSGRPDIYTICDSPTTFAASETNELKEPGLTSAAVRSSSNPLSSSVQAVKDVVNCFYVGSVYISRHMWANNWTQYDRLLEYLGGMSKCKVHMNCKDLKSLQTKLRHLEGFIQRQRQQIANQKAVLKEQQATLEDVRAQFLRVRQML